MVINKGADFKGIGNKFHIDPVTARIIRNREVIGDEEIHSFLAGTLQELPDVHLMQDLDLLVELLDQKINEKAKIRIIGDYDIDGVMSSYILYRALTRFRFNPYPSVIRFGIATSTCAPHLVSARYKI